MNKFNYEEVLDKFAVLTMEENVDYLIDEHLEDIKERKLKVLYKSWDKLVKNTFKHNHKDYTSMVMFKPDSLNHDGIILNFIIFNKSTLQNIFMYNVKIQENVITLPPPNLKELIEICEDLDEIDEICEDLSGDLLLNMILYGYYD